MSPIEVSLRLAFLAWGFLELLGYLWGGGIPRSADDYYLATPAIALLVGALVPNTALKNPLGIGVVGIVALTAIVQSVQQAWFALSLPNGGDLGAALLKSVTVLLLSLIVGRALVSIRSTK